MLENSLKKKLGYFINYSDIEYEVLSQYYMLELRMPSNGKLGQFLHEYLQGYLINGINRINEKYLPFYYNLNKALELLFGIVDERKLYYCDKKIEKIGKVKLIGQADICSDDLVIEIKSKPEPKKVDLMQALIYTYLYERDVILFMYGIYTGEYTIVKLPFNERNINSLFEGLKKISEREEIL
ncbi:hypothetical protein [Saccharolobus islandicus]|uniref:Uncharacterized protein n=1 Tax=Saccharolobus islandicus LAL14/1 TaxID=1241935 RepID=M9UH81_SACIS|nr:hypothetical protein [Sulfolobus islandicus]AGJ64006.1 Hypothetical Protein SiL_2573 [Sulfolobus islandicus LAL14/1]